MESDLACRLICLYVCTAFMKYLRILILPLAVFWLSGVVPALAQCPMCRMSVESNYADGGTGAVGLNIGILFLLSLPYLMVGTIAYVWWRYRRHAH